MNYRAKRGANIQPFFPNQQTKSQLLFNIFLMR